MKGTFVLLLMLVVATPAFSSAFRVKRDKNHQPAAQDVGRGRPQTAQRTGPKTTSDGRTIISLQQQQPRFVRQYQQPQQQTYVFNYRPPWQQQQQQQQQQYHQQARYIQPQRLPQQQQQPYSSGPQQRQPDHLYVPVPVQLSPSSVILPGPPAAGGASPQYKTQGAPSGLSTSASAQAPYLGPFQAQPQQQQQQHHHQQQHSAPIIPLQPPPLYVRQQQQQQHQQQSAPVAAAVAPPPPQQHSLAPLPPLFPPPLYTRGQSQSSAAPLPIPPPPESFAPLPVPPPPAPSSDSFSYSPEAPVTVPSVGDLHHDLPGAHTHQDDDLLNTNALAALPPPPLPVPGVPAPSGSASGSADESQWTKGSIPWVLESMGMNTLNDLLIMSGEDEVMDKEGPFTVFVPLDQAFEVLIQRFGGLEVASEQFAKDPEVLTSMLKHHSLAGEFPSSALQDNSVVQSLLGTPLRIKYYESEDMEWRPLKVITVNGARVVRPDIKATNGIIHIVDRVIFPVPQADIYNTLKNDPQKRWSTLVSAIDRAGLQSVLANPTAGPYTVFAPTNKAFAMISRAELNKILNDPARLTKLLQRHVVQDLIYTSGLQGFQKAYALDFEILYIYHAKGMTKVNGANVIDQDLTTLNGVIHTIDSVLGLY